MPALLSTGLSLEEIGCPDYEIAVCEPLHDIKNMVHHILTELPDQIRKPELKAKIKAFCKDTLGR